MKALKKTGPTKRDPLMKHQIGQLLEQHEVISLGQLARLLERDSRTVREAMKSWIHNGQVECLEPVSYDSEQMANMDLLYYRRIKCSDTDYTWQTQLMGCEKITCLAAAALLA